MIFINRRIRNYFRQLCVLMLWAGTGLNAQDAVRYLDPLAGRIDGRLIESMHALDDGLATVPALTSGLRQSLARVLPPAGVGAGCLPVTLDVRDLDDAKLRRIEAVGAVVSHSSAMWNSVTAMANLETIGALLKIDGVRSVQVPRKPISRQSGSTPNQGDAGMKTDQLRQQLGFTGKGSKIGVLANFINQSGLGPGATTTDPANPNYFFLSGLADQTSGDLPPSIQVLDFGPAVGPMDAVTAEGAAMMELIYDVAPGSSFAFASSLSDQTAMASNIQKLQQVGCNIVVDDQSYAEEPFFQDGPIAQQIGVGFAAGILHFSAAGNEGDQGVLAAHAPVTPGAAPDKGNTPSGNFFHNWGIGGTGLAKGFLPITIPAGGNVKIVLQWNQPYSTLNLGPGATDDLNTYLYTSADPTSAVVPNGSSTDPQGLNPNTGIAGPFGDPREIIDYINNDLVNPVTLYFAVDHVSGSGSAFSANVLMRLVFISDQQLSFPSGGVGAMTAFGHAASPGTISVGAVNYAQITGASSGILAEAYSARGGIGAAGVPYYFDTLGKPLPGAPVTRDCPDIAAPDGVSISFSLDGISAPNFFGTSAAAANAAGAAALLFEQVPLATSAQMRLLLKTSALDIATPGADDRTGNGLVDALNASALAPRVLTNPADITINKGTSGSFSVTASGSPALAYQWQKGGNNIGFVDISGATTATLTLNNVQAADGASQYRCKVGNNFGTTISKAGTLNVTLPPEITQQPVDTLINLGSTGTFTIGAINGSLAYQWRKNGVNIPSADASSYAPPIVTQFDNGTLYSCVVSNLFGSVVSTNAKLIVNLPPPIVSGPSANPIVVAVGKPITFSATALGSQGQAVTYAWDFGDGTVGASTPVAHIYATAASYVVTLAVTDSNNAASTAKLTVFVFNDLNGDGIPDLDASIDNAPFVDAYRQLQGYTPQTLTVSKLSISLNFTSKLGMDSLTLSGSLPLPAGFTPLNQPVLLVVGGVGRTFTLDVKGKASAKPNGTVKLAFKSKTTTASFGKFSVTIAKATLQDFFVADQLTDRNAKAESLPVRVTIFTTDGMFDKQQLQSYTAKTGKSGKTK